MQFFFSSCKLSFSLFLFWVYTKGLNLAFALRLRDESHKVQFLSWWGPGSCSIPVRISGHDQLGKGCGLGGGLGRSYEASKLFYYPKLFHYSKLPHNYLIPFWSVYCVACRPEDQYDIKEVPLLRGIFQWSDHIFLNLWCSKFAGRVQGYVGS